jgi:hypothetical protein
MASVKVEEDGLFEMEAVREEAMSDHLQKNCACLD